MGLQKIIRMLEDMRSELETEAANDEEIYEKITCWCKTNDDEKDKAVNAAQVKVENLEGQIQELKGKENVLEAKIQKVRKELDANNQSLRKARQVRSEEKNKFDDSSNEQLKAIKACEGAIVALENHNTDFAQVQAKLTKAFEKRPQLYADLSQDKQLVFKDFLTARNS